MTQNKEPVIDLGFYEELTQRIPDETERTRVLYDFFKVYEKSAHLTKVDRKNIDDLILLSQKHEKKNQLVDKALDKTETELIHTMSKVTFLQKDVLSHTVSLKNVGDLYTNLVKKLEDELRNIRETNEKDKSLMKNENRSLLKEVEIFKEVQFQNKQALSNINEQVNKERLINNSIIDSLIRSPTLYYSLGFLLFLLICLLHILFRQ